MANKNKPSLAPRNPLATAPIMKKGGAHKSKSSSSRLTPATLNQSLFDWREELAFERSLKDRSGENQSTARKRTKAPLGRATKEM